MNIESTIPLLEEILAESGSDDEVVARSIGA